MLRKCIATAVRDVLFDKVRILQRIHTLERCILRNDNVIIFPRKKMNQPLLLQVPFLDRKYFLEGNDHQDIFFSQNIFYVRVRNCERNFLPRRVL